LSAKCLLETSRRRCGSPTQSQGDPWITWSSDAARRSDHVLLGSKAVPLGPLLGSNQPIHTLEVFTFGLTGKAAYSVAYSQIGHGSASLDAEHQWPRRAANVQPSPFTHRRSAAQDPRVIRGHPASAIKNTRLQ
jgi:hypothetical protein